MPRCLVLSPYPTTRPQHGGQVRVDTIARALRRAKWEVVTCGIYSSDAFPVEERSPDDIVLDASLSAPFRDDMLFFDFLVARAAASDAVVVGRVREIVERAAPDIVHIEHPWPWLLLREALPAGARPKLVYSSQNIEWRVRPPLFGLGLRRRGAEAHVEAVKVLEAEAAQSADLVVSISDIEAAELQQLASGPVVHAPAVSPLADLRALPAANQFAAVAAEAGTSAYAALVASRYWPNLEGFFDVFPEGLGFLKPDWQIWIAGTLGSALASDVRYQDFLSINASRTRLVGYLPEPDKPAFFGAAACVLVPVRVGGGAKLKTADAIASGRPVIATPHALEGYGPIVHDAIGCGIYVADTPREFRGLIRQAMAGQAPGCPDEVRQRVSPRRLSHILDRAYTPLITNSGNGSIEPTPRSMTVPLGGVAPGGR